MHTLCIAAPDLRDFFAQWRTWQRNGALADGTVLHCVWQATNAPAWQDVAQHINAFAAHALAQGDGGIGAWQAQAMRQLQAHWWGLLPGWHRLPLEEERLILTLAIAPPLEALRSATGQFACIALHPDFFRQAAQSAATAPASDHPFRTTASALTPLCRPGTVLHAHWPHNANTANEQALWQKHLLPAGWVFQGKNMPQGASSLHFEKQSNCQQAVYAPHWLPAPATATGAARPLHAVVIGAGLSGAAAAYSLAQRGWQVTVLDAGDQPAAGASGLPVGLVVPHTSADDTRLSQLSRAGIRCTLHRAQRLLREGHDWQASGVLEHCVQGQSKLPRHWPQDPAPEHPHNAARDWSQLADATQRTQSGLPDAAVALWHPRAAWVKPPALVAALLQHPRIHFVGGQAVARLVRSAQNATASSTPADWVATSAHGTVLAQAPVVVLAAGLGTQALLAAAQARGSAAEQATAPWGITLDALRGQVAWGWHDGIADDGLPPFPINGKGSMAPRIPFATAEKTGSIWITGSTFARADTDSQARAAELPTILDKLAHLHPQAARSLQPAFASGQAQGWAGVRATLPDRMPAVGALQAPARRSAPRNALHTGPTADGLYVCCGMGARGLALAMFSGELLAAHIHHEPLPAEKKLATMLDALRFAQSESRPVENKG